MVDLLISRCLCELAKQIGFKEGARDIFKLEGQIASYMHLVSNIETHTVLFECRQLFCCSSRYQQ